MHHSETQPTCEIWSWTTADLCNMPATHVAWFVYDITDRTYLCDEHTEWWRNADAKPAYTEDETIVRKLA